MVVNIEQIREVAEPVLRRLGYELWDLGFGRGPHGTVLRVTIDGLGGVTLDDCARASRELSPALDVMDLIHVPYALEVSSPGLDRALRTPDHFRRSLGSRVDLRVSPPIAEYGGRRHFCGTLAGADDERIRMECDGRPYEIKIGAIQHARVVFEWGACARKKKG